MKLTSRRRFSAVCLHAGQEPDPSTGAIITPATRTLFVETPTNPILRLTDLRDLGQALDRV